MIPSGHGCLRDIAWQGLRVTAIVRGTIHQKWHSGIQDEQASSSPQSPLTLCSHITHNPAPIALVIVTLTITISLTSQWFFDNTALTLSMPRRPDRECVPAQLGASDALPLHRPTQHPVCWGPVLQDTCSGRQPAAELVSPANTRPCGHPRGTASLSALARASEYITLASNAWCGPSPRRQADSMAIAIRSGALQAGSSLLNGFLGASNGFLGAEWLLGCFKWLLGRFHPMPSS